MTTSQRLIEVNKYRRELGLTPWRKLWNLSDQKEWAGSIRDELDDDLQKQVETISAGAVPVQAERIVQILQYPHEDGQGKMPHRQHDHDAGLDLYSNKDVLVPCSGSPINVHTG